MCSCNRACIIRLQKWDTNSPWCYMSIWCGASNETFQITNHYIDLTTVWVLVASVSVCWRSNLSHRFPPLSKHVIDELGHGLGAAGAPPTLLRLAVQASIAHHLGEHERHLLAVLGGRQLIEQAAHLARQLLALLPAHLTHMAQVLLVAHQEHHWIRLPENTTDVEVSRSLP